MTDEDFTKSRILHPDEDCTKGRILHPDYDLGAKDERAKIVEYLRYYGMLRNIAAKIEAKEHLK